MKMTFRKQANTIMVIHHLAKRFPPTNVPSRPERFKASNKNGQKNAKAFMETVRNGTFEPELFGMNNGKYSRYVK